MDYFKRSRIKALLTEGVEKNDVMILGWVRTKRVSKNVAFLEINDGSGLKNIQVVIEAADIEKFNLSSINTGASVKVIGNLVKSLGKGQSVEMQPATIELLGSAPEDYPLQKKRHSNEFLREIAHLRPRTNLFGVINRFRSKMAYAVHSFFQGQGFYYAHTPIITANDAEGAGETFQVTTLNLQKLLKADPDKGSGIIDYNQDFFGSPTNLSVSGQLEAEILATALGDIYTFGPTFRAEKSNTTRHLSEFWMIEPEMAFADLQTDAKMAEMFLKYLAQYALDNCQEEMELFNKFVDKTHTRISTLEDIVKSDFETVTYTDAVKILENAKKKFEFPVKWGIDLQSEHERYLTENHFKKPVAVIDYPKDIKAFYMRLNDDEKTVAAMDVLVPQVGEIIGGSQREDRYDYLERAMIKNNIPMDNEHGLGWYLELRKHGSVPHAGFGLGFARLLMYFSGVGNVRDIIPFPRTPKNARF